MGVEKIQKVITVDRYRTSDGNEYVTEEGANRHERVLEERRREQVDHSIWDPDGYTPLKDLKIIVDQLIDEYGPEAQLDLDAGHNNISAYIRKINNGTIQGT